MSDSRVLRGLGRVTKSWWRAAFALRRLLAPHLHRALSMVLLSALATGWVGGSACVLPEDLHTPLEHAPRFVLGQTQPPPNTVLSLRQSAGSGSKQIQFFTTVVIDPDDQELRTRAFIDGRYERALALNNDEVGEPSRGFIDGRRSYFVEIEGLCDDKVNRELGRHVLELYVSDTGFVGRASDLRVPNTGGLRDSVLWVFNCLEPLPAVLDEPGGV